MQTQHTQATQAEMLRRILSLGSREMFWFWLVFAVISLTLLAVVIGFSQSEELVGSGSSFSNTPVEREILVERDELLGFFPKEFYRVNAIDDVVTQQHKGPGVVESVASFSSSSSLDSIVEVYADVFEDWSLVTQRPSGAVVMTGSRERGDGERVYWDELLIRITERDGQRYVVGKVRTRDYDDVYLIDDEA